MTMIHNIKYSKVQIILICYWDLWLTSTQSYYKLVNLITSKSNTITVSIFNGIWASNPCNPYRAPPLPEVPRMGLFFSYRCLVFTKELSSKESLNISEVFRLKDPNTCFISIFTQTTFWQTWQTYLIILSDPSFERSHCGEYYALYFATRISWDFAHYSDYMPLLAIFSNILVKFFVKVHGRPKNNITYNKICQKLFWTKSFVIHVVFL